METVDIFTFIGSNLKTLLFGAIVVEAVVEIIGDLLPTANNGEARKYSVKGARVVGAVVGVLVAFCFHISIVESVDGAMTHEVIIGTVIAGLIMSRSSEWIHSLIKSITSLPAAVAAISNKTATTKAP